MVASIAREERLNKEDGFGQNEEKEGYECGIYMERKGRGEVHALSEGLCPFCFKAGTSWKHPLVKLVGGGSNLNRCVDAHPVNPTSFYFLPSLKSDLILSPFILFFILFPSFGSLISVTLRRRLKVASAPF